MIALVPYHPHPFPPSHFEDPTLVNEPFSGSAAKFGQQGSEYATYREVIPHLPTEPIRVVTHVQQHSGKTRRVRQYVCFSRRFIFCVVLLPRIAIVVFCVVTAVRPRAQARCAPPFVAVGRPHCRRLSWAYGEPSYQIFLDSSHVLARSIRAIVQELVHGSRD